MGIFSIALPYISTVAIAYSAGGQFRRAFYMNIPMVVGVLVTFTLTFVLLLAPPNPVNCIFRVNCDNRVSNISYVPIVAEFTVGGNVGGCFYGPQAQEWFPRYKLSPHSSRRCLPNVESGLAEL